MNSALTILAFTLAADPRWQFRGLLEHSMPIYLREAEAPPARFVNETHLRLESGLQLGRGWQWRAALDAQASTQGQVTGEFSWFDHTELRPAIAARTLLLRHTRGPFRLELGKQPLEWGSMDALSPADRLAPRDLLSPSGLDRLGVWAARFVADTGTHRLELAYLPRFTPSRLPLASQRWAILPTGSSYFQRRFLGRTLPGGPQFGGRYSLVRTRWEASAVAFVGYQSLPSVITRYQFLSQRMDYRFVYPRVRLFGGALAAPWRGLLWKTETAALVPQSDRAAAHSTWSGFTSVEAVRARWQWLAGWYWTRLTAGAPPAYASGYGGRASWTPRRHHTLSAECALQSNARAMASRFLYARNLGAGVRAKSGYVWIYGASDELVGRFGVNSHVTLQLEWSF